MRDQARSPFFFFFLKGCLPGFFFLARLDDAERCLVVWMGCWMAMVGADDVVEARGMGISATEYNGVPLFAADDSIGSVGDSGRSIVLRNK